jgi:Leucine-rich repeat (LRR) protein
MLLSILKQLFDEDASRKVIDLGGRQLQSIDSSSLQMLSKFKNLRMLNLSDNYLTKLPQNLSMLS